MSKLAISPRRQALLQSKRALLRTVVVPLSAPGAAGTTGAKASWVAPEGGDIVEIAVSCTVAPAGSTAIADVNKNGTTLYTTQGERPTIADGSTSLKSTTTDPDVTKFAKGDVIRFDLDQIGSGTAGSGYTATFSYIAK